MKKLFISYAHTDKWQVKQLVDILKQGNYDAWFDHRLIVGGDWQAQLLEAIQTCDAFVYALSPESVESEWCQWEFAEAVKLGKPVIPVLIQGKTNIPPSIASRQYADFTEGPSVEGTARLIAGIHNAITIPPAEVSAPTKPTGKPAQIIRNGAVFISYSTKDDSYAYALEDHLKQQGFDVWIDKKGLRVQDSWTDTIENAVEDCAAFIVLMSEASKDSKWVRRELLHAQDCDKPIFPLLLNNKVWFTVKDIQFHDATNGQLPDEEFLSKLELFALRERPQEATKEQSSGGTDTNRRTLFLSFNESDPSVASYIETIAQLIADRHSTEWQVTYRAAPEEPDDLSGVELYVAVLGVFYGQVQDDDTGVLETEYSTAEQKQVATLIFLLPDEMPSGVSMKVMMEQAPLLPKLAAFRERALQRGSDIAHEITSPAEIETVLLDKVANLEVIASDSEQTATPPRPRKRRTFFVDEDQTHLSYDRRLLEAHKLDELDEQLIRQFLERPLARDAARQAGERLPTIERHLELLGLTQEGRITLGAFVCFAPRNLLVGKFSSLGLQMVVYDEIERSSSKASINLAEDNLLNLWEIGLDFLRTRGGLRKRGEVGSDARDDLEIPEIALREALANALVHRDYQDDMLKDQPSRIEVYPDRIAITSFGSLFGVSEKDLNENPEDVVSRRRNPIIAKIFQYMRFMELNASGISRMHVETRKAGLRSPKILHDNKSQIVQVIFYRPEHTSRFRDIRPVNLAEYHKKQIAEWTQPRYALDTRFVNLTLLVDQGEDATQRWQMANDTRFNSLVDVLAEISDPSLVLLGFPGSGKSALLRHFQLDHSRKMLESNGDEIAFFLSLSLYRGLQEPRDWLNKMWAQINPDLLPLDSFLAEGRVILLLDALNEMSHVTSMEYHEQVSYWRSFTQEVTRQGNRIVFSCRSLDYSASLSSRELRVPQIEIQPMSREQVHQFIATHTDSQAEMIWSELERSVQFDIFRTPYYLKLLVESVKKEGALPRGKATLVTQLIRQSLAREIGNPLFSTSRILTERDYKRILKDTWRNSFDLPDQGLLISSLARLAFTMQQGIDSTEGALVRIDYDAACDVIDNEHDESILKAGLALTVLDEDIAREEIIFFNQLYQEYFAARWLAQNPDPSLVHVEWQSDKVSPTLDETVSQLANGDPLPHLPQSGWEEITLIATPMAKDPGAFMRALMQHNLPLAARCAASPEVTVDLNLKHEIQNALIDRTQDFARADLRARIAAGLALGELGDPRFERRAGQYGDYLLPPVLRIDEGLYAIGSDEGPYDHQKPEHSVHLNSFQLGQFPVTNAEYALFIEAGGYEDEQWWDTDEARAWLQSGSGNEGQKQQWRDNREEIKKWSEDYIHDLVSQARITSEQAESWIALRNWTEEQFEEWLEEQFPSGKVYRQPEYWDDNRFNNPAQPVVGISWFEARAYLNWLSAQTSWSWELPSEVQVEAAIRGKEGRRYPYGDAFDPGRANTFEAHLRRTSPIGVFPDNTPENAFDLLGNVYCWTTSRYVDYPYDSNDGRENKAGTDQRVLRGGAWINILTGARSQTSASFREYSFPHSRRDSYGFRVCRSDE